MSAIDLLDYLRGDGRLYEVVNNWGGGAEVMQTQQEDSGDLKIFYLVKNSQWEELWSDDVFIYRGTDTSPGGGETYTLTEGNAYGSVWSPRFMTVGDTFRRAPTVTFRRKGDGQPVAGKPPFQQITWLRLVAVHDHYKFASGLDIADVAELHGFVDNNGKLAATPFEKYYYARGFGMVGWEDPTSTYKSWIAQTFTPEIMPQRVREVIPWLSAIRQRLLTVPKLPVVTVQGAYIVEKVPTDFVNVRAYPTIWGQDLGDLRVGDQVTVYTPQVNGWVMVESPYARGWVSLQNGGVAFSPATQPEPTPDPTPNPDIDPDAGDDTSPPDGGDTLPHDPPDEPLPPDPVTPTHFTWPGTKDDAIRLREAYRQVEEGARAIREELDRLIELMD